MELNKLIRENLRKYSAYEPGEHPTEDDWVILNTNENPYPPIQDILVDIKSAVNENIRLYPDPTSFKLRKEILNVLLRDKDTLTNRNSIFIGSGSDEILDILFKVFNHIIVVESGILEKECSEILKSFFKTRRDAGAVERGGLENR